MSARRWSCACQDRRTTRWRVVLVDLTQYQHEAQARGSIRLAGRYAEQGTLAEPLAGASCL